MPDGSIVIGGTNASWTLTADLVDRRVCRLPAHLDEHGYPSATPVAPTEGVAPAGQAASRRASPRVPPAIERRRPRPLIDWSAGGPDVLVRLMPGSYCEPIARRAGRPAAAST